MPQDLRARRRKQTAARIRTAAVDLVLEHGLEAVTAEMIAERAGISPRSFFNYFAIKEEALMPPPMDFEPRHVERFLSGSGPVLEDMMRLLETRFADVGAERERVRRIYELAREYPKLMLVRDQAFHQHEERIAALIARRMGLKPGAQMPVLMAAVLSAGIRVAMSRWARSASGTTALEELRSAFALLRGINERPTGTPLTHEPDESTLK